jgi:hypothetical protein
MKRLGLFIFGVVTVFSILGASAAAVDFFPNDVCPPGSTAAACSNEEQPLSGPRGVLLRVANIIAIIGGIAAVITIIVAGFIFVTAGGDASKVSAARTMITYAVVGLLVIFLARTIVAFIVTRV